MGPDPPRADREADGDGAGPGRFHRNLGTSVSPRPVLVTSPGRFPSSCPLPSVHVPSSPTGLVLTTTFPSPIPGPGPFPCACLLPSTVHGVAASRRLVVPGRKLRSRRSRCCQTPAVLPLRGPWPTCPPAQSAQSAHRTPVAGLPSILPGASQGLAPPMQLL